VRPRCASCSEPGAALGAVLAEAALAGRDKLTIVADTAMQSVAPWIEQLVAESSGKSGKGILPVPLEPLDSPSVYGADRAFVYLRSSGELDNAVAALSHSGVPIITLGMAVRTMLPPSSSAGKLQLPRLVTSWA